MRPWVRGGADQRRLGSNSGETYPLVQRVLDPVQEQIEQRLDRPLGAVDPAGPQDAGGGCEHGVGRIACSARGVGSGQHRDRRAD